MSVGRDETRGNNSGGDGDPSTWCGLEIGDGFLEECKGGGEGWRLGVGETGEDTR